MSASGDEQSHDNHEQSESQEETSTGSDTTANGETPNPQPRERDRAEEGGARRRLSYTTPESSISVEYFNGNCTENILVSSASLRRLIGFDSDPKRRHIDDKVVTAVLGLILYDYTEETEKRDVYIFNSIEEGFPAAEDTLKCPEALAQKEMWIIPICEKKHWYCVVVKLQKTIMFSLDCLGKRREPALNYARELVEKVLKHAKRSSITLTTETQDVPQRRNREDSGLCMILNVYYLLHGEEMDYLAKLYDMQFCRIRFATKLLTHPKRSLPDHLQGVVDCLQASPTPPMVHTLLDDTLLDDIKIPEEVRKWTDDVIWMVLWKKGCKIDSQSVREDRQRYLGYCKVLKEGRLPHKNKVNTPEGEYLETPEGVYYYLETLALVLNGAVPVPNLYNKVTEMCTQFRTSPEKKDCYNYFLMDPQILGQKGGESRETFERFVKAVFYVGKGTGTRHECHIKEAKKCMQLRKSGHCACFPTCKQKDCPCCLAEMVCSNDCSCGTGSEPCKNKGPCKCDDTCTHPKSCPCRAAKRVCSNDCHRGTKPVSCKNKPSKIDRIIDIWKSGRNLITLCFFRHVTSDEALCREACMIEAIGLAILTNKKKGSFKESFKDRSPQDKQKFGVYFLYEAYRRYLNDGAALIEYSPPKVPDDPTDDYVDRFPG